MFYRVDYTFGLMLVGLLVGALLCKRTQFIAPAILARQYYIVVAVVLAFQSGIVTCSRIGMHYPFLHYAGAIVGDLGSVLFGALFGLAARREDRRIFLVDPSILNTIRMVLAFTFVFASFSKALTFAPLADFFAQSGYPSEFLKFIIIAELFIAVGLLLPWAFVPALIGLTVDMLGVLVTHVHNGDSWNENTGAIAILIRAAVLGVLWMLRPREGKALRAVGNSLLLVAMIAVVCFVIAIGGSKAVRLFSQPVSEPSSSGAG
jgi:hypothetical protein